LSGLDENQKLQFIRLGKVENQCKIDMLHVIVWNKGIMAASHGFLYCAGLLLPLVVTFVFVKWWG
jgi:hypothetical protein